MIQVDNISKIYRIGVRAESAKTLGEAVGKFFSSPFRNMRRLRGLTSFNAVDEVDTIWALKDVSFTVNSGEVIGIIGRNGAGKSTLLKVLSRITQPTKGRALIQGRVSSLLEVGTGFHPELTGRENIYLNGTILGMRREEVTSKYDEIVEFSGVERFIDTPVKRYSSGMTVRLAFSVAAHLEPEVLIIDEVLAVGDAAFQQKCIGKMSNVANSGRTVLFVSHNMAAVRKLCTRGVLLQSGRVALVSDADSVIDEYICSAFQNDLIYRNDNIDKPFAQKSAELVEVSVKRSSISNARVIDTDDYFNISVEYELRRPIKNLRIGIQLSNSEGVVVFTSHDTDPDGKGTDRVMGHHVSECQVPGNLLNAGAYYITVACDQPMQEILFFYENIVRFTISSAGGAGADIPDGRLGVIRPVLEWTRK